MAADFSTLSNDDLFAALPKPSAAPAPAPAADYGSMSSDDLFKALPARAAAQEAPAAPSAPFAQQVAAGAKNLAMGVARGAKDAIDTGAQALASGFDKVAGTQEGARVRAMNQTGKAEFDQQYGDSTAASIGRVGGQIAATLPVGGAIGAGFKAGAAAGIAPRILAPLGEAVATGGTKAANAGLTTRIAGGAINGGASAGLVDPESAGTGAAIGAALPPALGIAGRLGEAAGSLAAPFFKSGQDRIVGGALRDAAADAAGAAAVLRRTASPVPGSVPTAAAASGDVGLAGLQRTMANRPGNFAAGLAERATAQNEARTAAFEAMAGNPGKISVAEQARDAATSPLREGALKRAGKVDAASILSGIDGMLRDPNNAGRLAQQALGSFRSQIVNNAARDTIDARALYAIRKDINEVLGGKLQGDAGNLRYAASQLSSVKGLIDDAIEKGSNRVPMSARTVLGAPGGVPSAQASATTTANAAPSWKQYLSQYSELSKPIDQMKALGDVLKRVQTGSMDQRGSLLISAAKLNNILKNEGADLAKKLTPEQLQVLRNVQADLNASTLAATAGKAVGSNTVQNLAGDQALRGMLGSAGGSNFVKNTLGAALRLPYSRAGQAIEDRLGEALLDPATAARLMDDAAAPSAARRALASRATSRGVRALPVLASGQGGGG